MTSYSESRSASSTPGRVRPGTGFHVKVYRSLREACPATVARSACSTTSVMAAPVSEPRSFAGRLCGFPLRLHELDAGSGRARLPRVPEAVEAQKDVRPEV